MLLCLPTGIKLLLRDAKIPEQFVETHALFKRGDIVGVTGIPTRADRGELSIAPSEVTLLAPNLHQLPSGHFGLKDQETRYRKRYLDLILSEETRNIFITRSRIVNYIRRFLDSLGFLEVSFPKRLVPGYPDIREGRDSDDEHDSRRRNCQTFCHSS